MQAISNGAPDRFAELLGVETLSCSFDQTVCRLRVRDEQRNTLGSIHGGLIFALADIAFAAACNAGEATYIGLQAEVRYMAQAQGEELTASATRMGGSRRIAHYQMLVSDALANPIALFTASAYRLGN